MNMNFGKKSFMAALLATALCTGLTACGDDDDVESTLNPAEQQVAQTKQHDTALMLCTFGSTYNESLSVYDDIIADLQHGFDAVK